MYKIDVHNRINQLMSLFHVAGLWQYDNSSGCRITLSKVVQFAACVYYPIGLFFGSLLNDDKIESVFQGTATLAVLVQAARLYYFLWNKDQIIELVRVLGTHTIRNRALNPFYSDVNSKIERFMNFASLFSLLILTESPLVTIAALMSDGKRLPMNVYFPMKENKVIYWFAFGFASYTITWYCMCTMLNAIIWYLMMSCAMKYEILGNEFRLMGVISNNNETLVKEQRFFVKEFIELIKSHQELLYATDKFKTTFSNLFFIQIITSGLNICGTVFSLAFVSIDNPFVIAIYSVGIIYFTFEIFMLTYFGNEIKIWSSRLSYCLFECDWTDQPKSCKQCIIILMEVLKQPQLLIIGELYPLDLDIFTKILKFAYSMFNVLMRFK